MPSRWEAEKRVYRTDVDDRTAMSARKHGSGLYCKHRKVPFRFVSRTRSHSSSGKSVMPANFPSMPALFTA